MYQELIDNPLFSLLLIFISYSIGVWCQRKSKRSYVNPLLISIIILLIIIKVLDIPLSSFNNGGDIVAMLLTPATAVLALSIYKQRELVKKNFIPIFVGSLVGSLVSVGSIILLSEVLGIESRIKVSLISKSVTTPIAIAISETLGGIQGITVCAVIFTGILGNILGPILVKAFRITSPTAQGIAIGTSSHALGTSAAIEMGEDIGAISGIALSFSGIITVLISLFL